MYSSEVPLPDDVDLKRLNGIKVHFPDQASHITFVHSLHTTANSLPDNMQSLIDGSDVILLEGVGWHAESAALDQAISNGDSEALKEYDAASEESEFWKTLRHTFYNSHKPVITCDLAYSRKTAQLLDTREELAAAPFAATSLREFLIAGRKFLDYSIREVCYGRDKYILRNIYRHLTSPEKVRELPIINGLYVIGSLHKTIPHLIRRQADIQNRTDQTVSTEFTGDTREALAEMYYLYLRGKSYADIDILKAYLLLNALDDPEEKTRIFDMGYDEAASSLIRG